MKKIVLEIDGVRHRLVDNGESTSCAMCSIKDFCEQTDYVMCNMPEYNLESSVYYEEKDSELGSPLKVEFDD